MYIDIPITFLTYVNPYKINFYFLIKPNFLTFSVLPYVFVRLRITEYIGILEL